MIITKKCKQDLACQNNLKQNPTNCKKDQKNTLCFCCCKGDACNNDDNLIGCWENKVPVTTPIPVSDEIPPPAPIVELKCRTLNEALYSGELVCTYGFMLNSLCTYKTHEIGRSFTKKCMEENGIAKWIDGPAPLEDREGPACPIFDEEPNRLTLCSDGVNIGSSCNFTCLSGFKLQSVFDSPTYDCIEGGATGAFWFGDSPTYVEKKCPALFSGPEGGLVWDCTNDNLVGSDCFFECGVGYAVSPPDRLSIMCLDNEEWSEPLPVCELLTCPEFEVKGGEAVCSDGLNVNSECRVTCDNPAHVTHPTTFQSMTCQPNTTWTGEPPCCVLPCPPHVPMDMVIVLDASSSVTIEKWETIKAITVQLILEFLRSNSTRFAVFRYNSVPDTSTQILLNDHNADAAALLNAVSSIPYGGTGTMTGVALGHAAEVVLHEDNGNRPKASDIVLLMTDGLRNAGSDDIRPNAQLLHSMGATVMAVTIDSEKSGRRFMLKELLFMTQHNQNHIFTPNGSGVLSTVQEITSIIENRVCQDLCNKYY